MSHSGENSGLRQVLLVLATLIMTLGPTMPGQTPPAAPAPTVQFVQVETGVELEVLDWGGTGQVIVMLAGGGDSAHVYDQFAPKLAAKYHVMGITRRGFGASSRPTTGYTAESLANDVLHVLDALKLERPVLVGHSVAGEELSSIGSRRPGRVAALIYLDAAWDRTYVPPKDRKSAEEGNFKKVGIHDQPKPDPARIDPRDAIGAGVQKPDYAHITVPALALYAAPRTWKELMPDAPDFKDAERRSAAEKVVAQMAKIRKHMADEFHSGVANSKVIEIPGASHYLFRTNEDDVLREILAYLQSLNL